MSRLLKAAPLVVLCALIIAVPPVWANWFPDGVPLCTTLTDQFEPPMSVSDGAGGAIVTWEDNRSGSYDIYVQRVNASGAVQWTTDGVALCTATAYQFSPMIISDGAGGAIVTWYDFRFGNGDIYAQRVNAAGAVQWTANGVALCTATDDQGEAQITSDGAGGAIVTWDDDRTGDYDIYAQRVNASGVVKWTTNGVALCTAAGGQYYPTIVPDGAGGAIVTWEDNRSVSDYHIYSQRVNASGAVQWTTDGVAVCLAPGYQFHPMIVSDGASGAIVTWEDRRGGNSDIYAQRVDVSGAVQWTTDGVGLCTAPWYDYSPSIVSDGAGGAIVAWYSLHSLSSYDIYAQRVDVSGAVQWTTDGVGLCTAMADQQHPQITSDGATGAIVTWQDQRNGNWDIYAQKVNASGADQWTTDGVILCTATGDQQSSQITSDGAGGAIVTWQDHRSGNWNVYAQAISSLGQLHTIAAPIVFSVQDVPHDQGGRVRITIVRSNLDDALEAVHPVLTYNVWQRIDSPVLLAMVARGNDDGAAGARTNATPLKSSVDPSSVSNWPIKELNGRYFVQSKELLEAGALPPGIWELVGSFAACQQDQYIYRASTLADSTASGIPYSVYMVSAHTTTPSIWFVSDPDSGYSVDNIPPEPPEGLVAEQSYTPVGLALSWNVNAANDLSYYAVYRGASGSFVPGPGNRVATPLVPEYFDGAWRWSSGYYYKVSAIDIHGNESGFALLTPDDVTGAETPKAPAANYLAQNYPNPFNPMTRIAFGLSAPGHVSLRIYDAAGRLVRTLAEGNRHAANYVEAWDGKDASGHGVASGIYFCRFDAGTFTQARKMILLR